MPELEGQQESCPDPLELPNPPHHFPVGELDLQSPSLWKPAQGGCVKEWLCVKDIPKEEKKSPRAFHAGPGNFPAMVRNQLQTAPAHEVGELVGRVECGEKQMSSDPSRDPVMRFGTGK